MQPRSTPLDTHGPTSLMCLVDSWLEPPCATVIHPTDRHSRLLRELLVPLVTAGNLTSDAHVAALSVEHGAELCFPRVRWLNPLAGAPRLIGAG